jgi:hypothetical protein
MIRSTRIGLMSALEVFFSERDMRVRLANASLFRFRGMIVVVVYAWQCAQGLLVYQEAVSKEPATTSSPAPAPAPMTFRTPQDAADALVNATKQLDFGSLTSIFGAAGSEVVFTGEVAQDRQRVADFAVAAGEQYVVSVDPKNRNRAFLLIGSQSWPFPVPILKRNAKWSFDAAAGRQELLQRRVGANELDAIKICRGYVEAQREYALHRREGYDVNQYAQRIISTPGKQDGLAWRNANGSWDGPVGEAIARAIEQGYSSRAEPYHGYFFKILKRQGPAAPLGELDFVIKGVMIGGFALVAAPAEYGVTGVKTFIVSHTGIVYEKDLGPSSLDELRKMESFNPDTSWRPVADQDD